jgi:hypothetical protein
MVYYNYLFENICLAKFRFIWLKVQLTLLYVKVQSIILDGKTLK